MKRSPLLAALLVLLAGRAAAQEPSRLDPALRLSRWSAGARVDSAAPAPTIPAAPGRAAFALGATARIRSEEHTSELQSRENLVCRLLLEKKKEEMHDDTPRCLHH